MHDKTPQPKNVIATSHESQMSIWHFVKWMAHLHHHITCGQLNLNTKIIRDAQLVSWKMQMLMQAKKWFNSIFQKMEFHFEVIRWSSWLFRIGIKMSKAIRMVEKSKWYHRLYKQHEPIVRTVLVFDWLSILFASCVWESDMCVIQYLRIYDQYKCRPLIGLANVNIWQLARCWNLNKWFRISADWVWAMIKSHS